MHMEIVFNWISKCEIIMVILSFDDTMLLNVMMLTYFLLKYMTRHQNTKFIISIKLHDDDNNLHDYRTKK